MITSSSFVFGNSNKRFTILNIYDDNNNSIINSNIKEIKSKSSFEDKQKNKCCIIS
jgi:hypothetical protein